jgi:catechol 2,3-dioxygenase-like lactoylglutathione lyase family enzyme
MTNQKSARVRQLRVVITADDYEAAVAFYRDVLGLEEQAAFEGEGDARVSILLAGSATLEIANPAQTRMIDGIETDGVSSPKVRLAFEVDDAQTISEELVEGGAKLLAEARETPWRSLNARLDAPAGMQITLFQELETLEERAARPGFGKTDNQD